MKLPTGILARFRWLKLKTVVALSTLLKFWRWSPQVKAALIQSVVLALVAYQGASLFAKWDNSRIVERRKYDIKYSIYSDFHSHSLELLNAVFAFSTMNQMAANAKKGLTQEEKQSLLEGSVAVQLATQNLQRDAAACEVIFSNKEISKNIFGLCVYATSDRVYAIQSGDDFQNFLIEWMKSVHHNLVLMNKEIFE